MTLEDAEVMRLYRQLFPVMFSYGSAVTCPVVDCPRWHPTLLRITIAHLNDDHRWSREAIADWLDTLDIDLSINPKEGSNAWNHSEEASVSDHHSGGVGGSHYSFTIIDDITNGAA